MRAFFQYLKKRFLGSEKQSPNSRSSSVNATSIGASTTAGSAQSPAIEKNPSSSNSRPIVRYSSALCRVPRERVPGAPAIQPKGSISPRPTPSNESESPFTLFPELGDVPPAEREQLFIRKLKACAVIYDFTSETHIRQKEEKRLALADILAYTNITRNCFTEGVIKDVLNMVTSNIFRTLPPTSLQSSVLYDPEEDEPNLECAWPHLQMVYELLLRFVQSNEVLAKSIKNYIDHSFILQLVELLHSDDPRERDYVKTTLHRIYGKVMSLRPFIRKAMQNVFLKFIYDADTHNGISELLEILGSIVNGFCLPLKSEHRMFLLSSILPLHKAKTLNVFQQPLSYCIQQYIDKENSLCEPILLGLLRYWPVTSTSKEVLFINQLEEILEVTQPVEFQRVMEPLFQRLAECIQSTHFQVAERVLFLWNNAAVCNLMEAYRATLYPITVAALYRNSQLHWNDTVHGLTFNVSKVMAESDPTLFDTCSNRCVEEKGSLETAEKERARRWKELEAAFEGAKVAS